MKNMLFIISALLVLSSCATTKDAKIAQSENRKEKNLANQEIIKQAVESRSFIIKLDRLYYAHGRSADLIPRTNYIIIDGDKAYISAAYMGRQYDIRPIAGINMRGNTLNYELISDYSKGVYKINMKVNNGETSFNVNLKIGKNGSCSASLSSIKIDFVRYSGHIVPIRNKSIFPDQDNSIRG